jgi:glycine hydroxymethyltransferase
MNLLPFESLDQVSNPAGIRLGVQEMTRFGMKEPEMEMIARLFKRCLIEGKYVGDEVTEFRQTFQEVHYSFDDLKSAQVLSLGKETEK